MKKRGKQFAKGNIPWNKGIIGKDSHSFGKIKWHPGGDKNPFYDKKHSKEAIEKMRNAKLGKVGSNLGKTWKVKDTSNCNFNDCKGEKHWNWKGGISNDNRLLRQQFRKQLQLKILERDNYTCQVCSQYSGNLQVDHIKSWKNHPELRFDLDNCRTLCMACHYYVTFKRKMPEGTIWGHNLCRRVG